MLRLKCVITRSYRFLCSYRFLLSVFFPLFFLLICETCGLITLPRPNCDLIASVPVFALHDVCIYVMPITTLWARMCSQHFSWMCKCALTLAIAIMSVSIFSFSSSIFEWSTTTLNATFLYCFFFPVVLFVVSFLFVHGLYSIFCFMARYAYKTVPKKCKCVYVISISCIYLVWFLIGGNIFR